MNALTLQLWIKGLRRQRCAPSWWKRQICLKRCGIMNRLTETCDTQVPAKTPTQTTHIGPRHWSATLRFLLSFANLASLGRRCFIACLGLFVFLVRCSCLILGSTLGSLGVCAFLVLFAILGILHLRRCTYLRPENVIWISNKALNSCACWQSHKPYNVYCIHIWPALCTASTGISALAAPMTWDLPAIFAFLGRLWALTARSVGFWCRDAFWCWLGLW